MAVLLTRPSVSMNMRFFSALMMFMLPISVVHCADLANATGQVPPTGLPSLMGYEIRFGVYAHDPYSPEHGSADLNGEVLFPKWWSIANPFWNQLIPHADLGFTANFVGKTSLVYGGAAWNFDITKRTFVTAEFGPSLNNGKTGNDVPAGFNRVGCTAWFHESVSGGYRLTSQWSVMATVEHSSNAHLCDENRGVTNYGLRLGYRF